ncbi:RHS repeat protein, partial [bacterium]
TNTSAVLQKYYNGLGQLLQTRMAGAVVNGTAKDIIVDYAYDSMGQAWKQSMPRDVATGGDMAAQNFGTVVQTSYDALGRTLTVTQPDGTTTNYAYTLSGTTLVTAVTDANDNTTTQKSDAFGRLLSVLPAGYPANPGVSYTYDALDRLKTATYGDALTEITYDLAGRKIDMTDPDMGKWYYQYDAVGNLIRQTDAKGQRTCLYFDALNRLLGKHYRSDDSCPTPPTYNVSYTYDAGTGNLSQRTGMSDASGSTAWTYDARGRLASEVKTVTGVGSFKTTWGYNSADLLSWMKYPANAGSSQGETVTSTYLPQMAFNALSGTSLYVQSTQYDAAGRLTLRVLGANTLRTTQSYFAWDDTNGQGGLQFLQTGTPTLPTSLQNLEYGYDAVGNIDWIKDWKAGSPQLQDYGYDNLYRLTSASATGGTGGAYASEAYT